MPRFFNTAGPCIEEEHYMLPSRHRLPTLLPHIENKRYFVLHAPRQSGKTTVVQDFARTLSASGKYAALYASCETAQPFLGEIDQTMAALVDAILEAAENNLPQELRPAPISSSVPPGRKIKRFLSTWSASSPLPVVLFLDEIDSLAGPSLISVLRQLRDGYISRPAPFPQSVCLVGMRDVRDYRSDIRPDAASLGTSSPFNIKVESLTLKNFTQEEVGTLYRQHTEETGQVFTDEAVALAWRLTRGQPWLVNALAEQITNEDVPDRTVPITAQHIEDAKETLILRRDTHLDSLMARLQEPRIQHVIEPLLQGEMPDINISNDDLRYVADLGLVTFESGSIEIANPIYAEVIPRELTWSTQVRLPFRPEEYLREDDSLDLDKILKEFESFWLEHGEVVLGAQPYHEAAPHLVLMAFVQRIVNSGGAIHREYAVGTGRMDLLIEKRLPSGQTQRAAIEIKVWRNKRPDPEAKGLEQLTRYLNRLGLGEGTLVIFDRRDEKPTIEERVQTRWTEHEGKRIRVMRL